MISSDFIELAHSESSIGVILSCDHSLAKKNVLTTEDLKTVPLITLNTENRSQTRLLECLQAKGLTIDSVLAMPMENLLPIFCKKGFVSFYAGKESSLAENECFRPLSDLQLQWEFFIYGKRSHRITSLQRELIQQILSAVSPH